MPCTHRNKVEAENKKCLLSAANISSKQKFSDNTFAQTVRDFSRLVLLVPRSSTLIHYPMTNASRIRQAKDVDQFGADTPIKYPVKTEENVLLALPLHSYAITGGVLPTIGG